MVPVDTEAVGTAGSLLFKCGLSMMGFRKPRSKPAALYDTLEETNL